MNAFNLTTLSPLPVFAGATTDNVLTARPATLEGKTKATLEDMKRHLANLDKIASGAAAPAEAAKKGAESAKNESINWGTEVGAIDKAITEMVGVEPATPSTPTPTGTSGKAGAIDDATRAKLMEVRTHITAYAASMAGASTPKTEAAASPETEARPQPSMTPSSPSPSPQNPPAQSPSPSPAQPDPNAASPAQPPAGQQQPPAAQPPAAQGQPQVDTDAAHKHLVTARETLAQLTQLPAAAQLSGEARNQVSQLITNFNELITTQANWKASYDKVNANLMTLLGPGSADTAATAGAPTPNQGTPTPEPGAPTPNAAPTPGAVGTAGTATVELDPAIRAKLVEFRKSLDEFRKAAGGA